MSCARPKPRVIVSRCLGFAACRYDGAMLSEPFLAALAPFVEFVPVCPEEAIGLGTPRDPIRIVENTRGARLLQPSTARDLTDAMQTFADGFLAGLASARGFVLKSRSPSCGLTDTQRFPTTEATTPIGQGPGMFGALVLARFPELAVIDELGLQDAAQRRHFLEQIFAAPHLEAVLDTGALEALLG